MIPPFKYYFSPFLRILEKRGCCRLYDLADYIAVDLSLSEDDKKVKTSGGRVTKHLCRVNYCASYLKKMNFVETMSIGAYSITNRGKEVLAELGPEFTLTDLRNCPEFIATQINKHNNEFVYVRPHIRGNKQINGYVCNKKNLKSNNPNIESVIIERYRQSL